MVLDDIYSSMILADLGIAFQGDLDEEAQRRIQTHVFDPIKKFSYFTFLFVDGERVPTPEPYGFAARLDQGRLVVEFDLPYPIPVTGEVRRLTLAVYDETFNVFMDFPTFEIAMAVPAGNYHIDWEDRFQTEVRYCFDQITPVVADVTIRRK